METIEKLVAGGILHQFELPNWERRLPIWPLFVADDLYQWVDAKPEMHDETHSIGGRLLVEHLITTLSDFRCSKRPPAGNLRRMIPNGKGIWKVHPPGQRLYGWFPAAGAFVVVAGALEAETKNDRSINTQRMKQVTEFIRTNGLTRFVMLGDVLAIFPPQN